MPAADSRSHLGRWPREFGRPDSNRSTRATTSPHDLPSAAERRPFGGVEVSRASPALGILPAFFRRVLKNVIRQTSNPAIEMEVSNTGRSGWRNPCQGLLAEAKWMIKGSCKWAIVSRENDMERIVHGGAGTLGYARRGGSDTARRRPSISESAASGDCRSSGGASTRQKREIRSLEPGRGGAGLAGELAWVADRVGLCRSWKRFWRCLSTRVPHGPGAHVALFLGGLKGEIEGAHFVCHNLNVGVASAVAHAPRCVE